MELDPKALSDDGYIIDQRQTESISFGGCPSSKNGCGWIAAYNFLKALDRAPDPDVLLHRLERTLLPGGRLGLNFLPWFMNCAIRGCRWNLPCAPSTPRSLPGAAGQVLSFTAPGRPITSPHFPASQMADCDFSAQSPAMPITPSLWRSFIGIM